MDSSPYMGLFDDAKTLKGRITSNRMQAPPPLCAGLTDYSSLGA